MIANWIAVRRSAAITIITTRHAGNRRNRPPGRARGARHMLRSLALENIPTGPGAINYADIRRRCPATCCTSSIQQNWWGETRKSGSTGGFYIFGTGTEDYYGYAMCWRDLFTHVYHNQTHSEKPGNSGHTCLSRFHVLDDLPFNSSFKFDMEIWHLEECLMNYAATSWWYALPGTRDTFQPLRPDRLTIPQLPRPEERKGNTGWPNE